MSTHLTIRGLALTRGDRPVCRNLSMTLARGECVHLAGPNGSGKTTVMQAICGLLRPEAGSITWQAGSARTHAHYCAHSDALKPVWTVAENLDWHARLHDCKVDAARRQRCLEDMGLEHLADTPAAQLSQGERRRTALLKLGLMPRPVWLLDEPFNALDTDARACLVRWINRHREAGGAVMFSSHAGHPPDLGLTRQVLMQDLM